MKIFDVVIVGGSFAGLSAAMALGRSLRRVLILDSAKPCNLQTPHSHNFLTKDGEKPAAILQKAKSQVLAYPTVSFSSDLVTDVRKSAEGFEIETFSKQTYQAKKIILATGIRDILPEFKGFRECWGISVIHCPYCHGYEFRGKKTAIWAKGERAYHLSMLISNLTNDLSLIGIKADDFSTTQLEKLTKNGIKLIEKEPKEIHHQSGHLTHVEFEDGTKMPFDAIYADVPFEIPGEWIKNLGCKITEAGRIEVDQFQQTSMPGVFACGDATSMMRSVANSVAQGNIAGAMVNNMLAAESF